MRIAVALLLACLGAVASGCATYQSDLARGQKAYEQNSHERSLAILRSLEPHIDRLSLSERGQYAYLRGMSDHRIGYRSDARHWLAIAQSIETQTPGSLPSDWAKRTEETLKELNEEVFTGGVQALTNTPNKQTDLDEPPVRKKPKRTEDVEDKPTEKPAAQPVEGEKTETK